MRILIKKGLKKLIKQNNLMLGQKDTIQFIINLLQKNLELIVDKVDDVAKQRKRTVMTLEILQEGLGVNINDSDDLKTSQMFTGSYIAKSIRSRNLMVAANEKENPIDLIKVLMTRYLEKLIDKIRYVVKQLANKTIIKTKYVEAAQNML